MRFAWTNLATEDGHTIPAADVEYFLVDWYKLRRNWMTNAVFYAGSLDDVPDPLLPGRAIAIRRQVHTPFIFVFIPVRTRRRNSTAGRSRWRPTAWPRSR